MFFPNRGATDVEARLWEISENLHRAELSALERAEQVNEWLKLTESKPKELSNQVGSKVANDGTRRARPEGGKRAGAREIGVNREAADRAGKIAAISPEAKEAAREAGLARLRRQVAHAQDFPAPPRP